VRGGPALGLAALLALSPAPGAPAQTRQALLFAEGNRLHRLEIDSLEHPPVRERVLIERASGDPARGRDVNGMICALPDGSGRFVAGDDTGQPASPPGWSVFDREGAVVARLVATAITDHPEPYGCAFDPGGRLFTTELGDPGFLRANGQLILWFPPYDRDPGPAGPPRSCKIATDIGTASGIAIDREGRVYVASAGRLAIRRFSPPFPTAPDAAGGCAARDATGAPLADSVRDEVFVRALATFSGLAMAPNGHLYAASVATGEIREYDLSGRLVRMLLDPPGWLPPFATGTPQGLGVDAAGALYYTDLDLVWRFPTLEPGPDGKIWRIGFDARGQPLPPEAIAGHLEYPDGLGVADAAR
jgi:sugar lactone lactonase YvrE